MLIMDGDKTRKGPFEGTEEEDNGERVFTLLGDVQITICQAVNSVKSW